MSADRKLLYLDASALVKLVVEEAESNDLEQHLDGNVVQATSSVALVEVPRAARVANPSDDLQREASRLLEACMLVDVSERVLRSASTLASREVRTLDAIHLATALYIEADEVVAYDHRLLAAAEAQGITTAAPGGP